MQLGGLQSNAANGISNPFHNFLNRPQTDAATVANTAGAGFAQQMAAALSNKEHAGPRLNMMG